MQIIELTTVYDGGLLWITRAARVYGVRAITGRAMSLAISQPVSIQHGLGKRAKGRSATDKA
jgi:hypothetical protein